MADRIPQVLHFIWVGAKIPQRQAACILSWMHKNPDYVTRLWTNRQAENAHALADMANTMPTVFGAVAVTPAHEVSFERQPDRRACQLQCKDIAALSAVTGDALWSRFDAEIDARNFGGASDIARIAALSAEGGVYLDTDSDALAPLRQLSASDGILFGRLADRGFCNAIIAAPKGHAYLQEVLDAITSDYNYWERKGLLAGYRKGVEDARAAVTTATNRQKRLLGLRDGGLDVGDDLAELERSIKGLRSRLQEQMSSGTLLITGPTRVALWLYMHTGGAHTVLSWAKDNGIPESAYDTHLKLAQLVAQFQNIVVGPHIGQASIVRRYGFPIDCARINSEASWIK